eukprot:UN23008
MTKQPQDKDTPETAKLRSICNEIDIEVEDDEARLSLARFVRWRTTYVKDVNLEEELRLVSQLLNFSIEGHDDAIVGNWIRTKFEIAFACKNIVELRRVEKAIKKLTDPPEITEISQTMYYQTYFKLACLFGDWENITKFGDILVQLQSVVQNPVTGRREQ